MFIFNGQETNLSWGRIARSELCLAHLDATEYDRIFIIGLFAQREDKVRAKVIMRDQEACARFAATFYSIQPIPKASFPIFP